jgi:hypothetical protein
MIKLYRSAIHFDHWIAYSPATGWTMFPAQREGWHDRRPAHGIDPLHLREVPLRLAFNTGLPGTTEILKVAA